MLGIPINAIITILQYILLMLLVSIYLFGNITLDISWLMLNTSTT